jgi:hypothetical protein
MDGDLGSRLEPVLGVKTKADGEEWGWVAVYIFS